MKSLGRVCAALTIFVAAALLLLAQAFAQGTVLQSGPMVPGHVPMYLSSGGNSQATLFDSGPAGGAAIGYGLSEKLLQARGPGTGPLGTHDCNWSTYATNPAGAYFLCFDPLVSGGGVIDYGVVGPAPPLPLSFVVNGIPTTLPFTSPGFPLNPAAAPYSCKGDGVTNDTACWQEVLAACGAAPGGSISIPPNFLSYVNATISDNGRPCLIHGNNPANGNDNALCSSGLTDVASGTPGNINILSLTGTGSKIDHVCILAGAASTPAAGGAGLTTGSGVNQAAEYVTVKFGYLAFVGAPSGSTNSLTYDHDWAVSPASAGWAIGQGGSAANTVDLTFTNNRVTCAPPDVAAYGVALYSVSVAHWAGNDIVNCNVGTGVIPGQSQIGLGFFSDVMGDSSIVNQLLLQPSGNGLVEYFNCVRCWIGMNNNSTGSGVLFNQSGSARIQNVSYSAGIAHGSTPGMAQNIFDIEGNVTGGKISDNMIAADGGGSLNTGIFYNGSGTGWVINGNNFNPNESALAVALNITSSANNNSNITACGNNFANSVTPISYNNTAVNFIFNDNCPNYPGAAQVAVVASAAGITIPASMDVVDISGTTTVNTITPFWQIRHIRLRLNSSGLTLSNGTDGMCASFTSSFPGQGLDIFWNPNLQCWDQG